MADPGSGANDATLVQEEDLQAQALELSRVSVAGARRAPDLPGYELKECLGAGSFGEVWSGIQVRTGQTVAVKIITVSASMNWHYLEHEVARLRQVAEHPHVVTLLDADLKHDPPYFVMTLHSRTLQGWSAQGQADGVARVVQWWRQMASALQYTHARGLLHCDLKPSNVLLDSEGLARLSDFGQSVGRGQPAHSLGSLGYMGPEQASREAIPEVSWDIYGLGATVYSLLTGQTPRLDEGCRQELATLSDSQTKLQRYLELLESRPLVPVRHLHPGVDPDLAAIVESCLVLDPARRTAHMGQILEDLDRRQSLHPLLCRRPWGTGYRLGRLVRRHRQGVVLGTVALLMLGYVGYSKLQSDQAARVLMARQQWEQGWSLQRQGREGEALLWWARQSVTDKNHSLVLGQASAHLTSLERLADPATVLAYAEDGRLLVATPSEIRLGDQSWPLQAQEACHDLGPYRIPQPSAGLLGDLLVTRNQGELQVVGAHSRGPIGGCDGAVVVGQGLALYSDGQQLRVYHGDSGSSVPLEDSSGPLRVGAVGWGWAACAHGSEISVWNAETGHKLPLKLAHEGDVQGLCLSPDGHRLASAGVDNRALLWELPSGRRLGQLQGKMMMMSCQFSPDGQILATCNYDGTVELRRGSDLSSLGRPPLKHRWMVYGATFSRSGRLLATCSIDGTARCWDSLTGQPVSPFLQHSGPVRKTAFSPDEKELATAALDGTVRRFGLHPEPRVRTLQRAEEKANFGDYTADGRRAVVALGSQVQLWDVKEGRLLKTLSLEGVVQVARFSPDGKVLFTAGTDLCRWDAESFKPLGPPVPMGSEVQCAQFSPDGHWLATGTLSGQLALWDVATGQPGPPLEGHQARITSIEFSPDSQRWVSCSADGVNRREACLREYPSGRVVARLQHESLGIMKAIFRPDGAQILTCGEDARARWWDGRSGQPLPIPPLEHSLGIWDGAWSPAGDFVVTASGDSTLQIWNGQGKPLTPPLQHDGPVVRVEISRDGRRIVSSSKDGSARVWDARSGESLLAPVRHGDMVFVCRLSPDDKQLLTAANDGSIKLLDLEDSPLSAQQLRQRVESWTGLHLDLSDGVPRVEALTPEEWSGLSAR